MTLGLMQAMEPRMVVPKENAAREMPMRTIDKAFGDKFRQEVEKYGKDCENNSHKVPQRSVDGEKAQEKNNAQTPRGEKDNSTKKDVGQSPIAEKKNDEERNVLQSKGKGDTAECLPNGCEGKTSIEPVGVSMQSEKIENADSAGQFLQGDGIQVKAESVVVMTSPAVKSLVADEAVDSAVLSVVDKANIASMAKHIAHMKKQPDNNESAIERQVDNGAECIWNEGSKTSPQPKSEGDGSARSIRTTSLKHADLSARPLCNNDAISGSGENVGESDTNSPITLKTEDMSKIINATVGMQVRAVTANGIDKSAAPINANFMANANASAANGIMHAGLNIEAMLTAMQLRKAAPELSSANRLDADNVMATKEGILSDSDGMDVLSPIKQETVMIETVKTSVPGSQTGIDDRKNAGELPANVAIPSPKEDVQKQGNIERVKLSDTAEKVALFSNAITKGVEEKVLSPKLTNEHLFNQLYSIKSANEPVTVDKSAGMPEQAQASPKDSYNVTMQIIEQMRINTKQQSTEMIIKLRPEHLGNITLKIAMEQGVVNATFHTANSEVGAVIESALAQLRQELSSQGIKVANLDVSQGMNNQFSGHTQDHSANLFNGQEHGKKTGRVKINDSVQEVGMTPVEEMLKFSSGGIDYRV